MVSLLPADMVRDLRLVEHGYHVYPQGPYFAPRRDGGYLAPARRPGPRGGPRSRSSPRATPTRTRRWEAWLADLGQLVGPLLDSVPPKVGSKRPGDLLGQAGLLRTLRRVDVRAAFDLTRLFTASIADLVEERFASDGDARRCSASPGVIGTWAGPRSAGTAFVMLHHHLDQTGGQAAGWGFARGGMGAVTQAMAAAARSFGVEIRTDAPVARIDVRDGAHDRRDPGRRHRAQRADGRDHHRPPADLVPRPGRPGPSCPATSWPTSRPGRAARARSR